MILGREKNEFAILIPIKLFMRIRFIARFVCFVFKQKSLLQKVKVVTQTRLQIKTRLQFENNVHDC